MIPIRGAVRRPHFRHARDDMRSACNWETYLHRTAKKRIAQAITRARRSGTPYWLRVPQEIACAKRASVLPGRCRHKTRKTEIDLTTYGQVTIEAVRGALRFDLLLEGPAGSLVIEIAVTHSLEKEKQDLGHPMVEISLSDEEGLLALDQAIDAAHVPIETWGVGPAMKTCGGSDCASACLIFEVFRGGSTRLQEAAPWAACKPVGARVHREVFASKEALGMPRMEALDRLTRRAYFDLRQPVRSCLVCRHHERTGNIDGRGPIWCQALRVAGSVNMGAKCYAFTPYASAEELRHRRLEEADSGGVLEAVQVTGKPRAG
jgi:hypothetical protein